ncbi:MAG: hypothetical protein ACRDRJ_26355 [Streptosporangiaceae bacterium]
MTGFAVEVFQNEYLPEGGREVSAIVTVTSADDDLAPDDDLGGDELIMIDCSRSMAGAARSPRPGRPPPWRSTRSATGSPSR